MEVFDTEIPGLIIIKPKRFKDERGFFVETFQQERYAKIGLRDSFVQDNWSRSSQGVLRGLHLQNPVRQGKLVSVVHGTILDIAVDVRVGSPTFGRHVAVELSEDNGLQLFVPRGFAHGFAVLSGPADVFYKCDNAYSHSDEKVIRWNDPQIGIDWRLSEPLVSARDAAGSLLADARGLPTYEG
jgi:dTDP-4-dehydrorhamnose 3,5-epimerase